MPMYGYVCRSCGKESESPTRRDVSPCPCGGVSVRDWSSVTLRTAAFRPHFNHAVGRYVSSSRDFDEALKLGADKTGSTYRRLDPGDIASMGPVGDTQSLEDQARIRRDRLLTPPSTSTIISM